MPESNIKNSQFLRWTTHKRKVGYLFWFTVPSEALVNHEQSIIHHWIEYQQQLSKDGTGNPCSCKKVTTCGKLGKSDLNMQMRLSRSNRLLSCSAPDIQGWHGEQKIRKQLSPFGNK